MANAWCINAIWFDWTYLRTLDTLDSANIGVGVQYCIPAPLDDKRLDYIKYTDKCGCTCCITGENEILVYATNWVIKNFTLTNNDTNEVVNVKWNELFGSNRAYTMVRYKTWSYPTSITDWTLAVKETTQNQYSVSWYNVSWLTDWTTYYFTAFAVSQDGTTINMQSSSITTNFFLSKYQLLEYIQSNSTWSWTSSTWQYINTGVAVNNKMKVVFKLWNWLNAWTSSNDAFSADTNWTTNWFGLIAWYYNFYQWITCAHNFNDWNIHTWEFSQQWLYKDWTLLTTPATYTFTWPNLCLFALNRNWAISEHASLRIYYFKIYNNGVLVRDFIPVYRKSDNAIWLVDKVNKVFYPNQWSWSFTKWPNVN